MEFTLWGVSPFVTRDNASLWGTAPIYEMGPTSNIGFISFEATVIFDGTSFIPFEVDVPPRRKAIAITDLNELFDSNIEIARQEPEQIEVFATETDKDTIDSKETEKQRIENAVKRLQDWIGAAQTMQTVLQERLKDRKVRVDPKKNPAVRESIRRLFGVDSDTITYDMYKRALELRSKLIADGRKETYGSNDTGN